MPSQPASFIEAIQAGRELLQPALIPRQAQPCYYMFCGLWNVNGKQYRAQTTGGG